MGGQDKPEGGFRIESVELRVSDQGVHEDQFLVPVPAFQHGTESCDIMRPSFRSREVWESFSAANARH